MFDVNAVRKDFFCLLRKKEGKPPIYFDNACMTLRPSWVIQQMDMYYLNFPACVGRSSHWFAQEAQEAVSKARVKIAKLIDADVKEIFVNKNTSEAINWVAHALDLKEGDVVITSDKEHNSNFLPWRRLAIEKGVKYITIPTSMEGLLDLQEFEKQVEKSKNKLKLVSIVGISNLDGVYNDLKKIYEIVKNTDALFLIDGAQLIPHKRFSVKDIPCDFLAFSVHKMMGPSLGILYIRKEHLDWFTPPFIGGGNVVNTYFDLDKPLVYAEFPDKFETGLQDYAGIIGAGAAAEYLMGIDLEKVEEHEKKLTKLLMDGLKTFKEIEFIGPKDPNLRNGIVTFYIKKPAVKFKEGESISEVLSNRANIMVRTGQFCVYHWFNKRNFPKMYVPIRISLYAYNTKEEVEEFLKQIEIILKELEWMPTVEMKWGDMK